jgi:hypothetical protein
MPDILGIDRIEIALAKTKVVYGIKQIGFTYPIIPYKTIDPGRK